MPGQHPAIDDRYFRFVARGDGNVSSADGIVEQRLVCLGELGREVDQGDDIEAKQNVEQLRVAADSRQDEALRAHLVLNAPPMFGAERAELIRDVPCSVLGTWVPEVHIKRE